MPQKPYILFITEPADFDELKPGLESMPARLELCPGAKELSVKITEQLPNFVLIRLTEDSFRSRRLLERLPVRLPVLLLCESGTKAMPDSDFFSRPFIDFCFHEQEIPGRLRFLAARSEAQNMESLKELREELVIKEDEIVLYEELLQKAGESFTEAGIQAQLLERQIGEHIDYATVAKSVAMPGSDYLSTNLREFMLLYLPMARVSGDFYWLSAYGGKKVLAVGDCTGHGVPGAFMSILAIIMLERLVNVEEIMDSETILKKMDIYLEQLLNTPDRRHDDTIDFAICIVDKVTRKFEFAGAKNSLLMIEPDGTEKLFRGSRRGLGGGKHSPAGFKKEEISYKGDEIFFVSSDGFRDQLGSGRQRFGRQRFHKLLAETSALPPDDRAGALKTAFYDWKAGMPQLDDILVIGFKP